jgi:hypothetical protein
VYLVERFFPSTFTVPSSGHTVIGTCRRQGRMAARPLARVPARPLTGAWLARHTIALRACAWQWACGERCGLRDVCSKLYGCEMWASLTPARCRRLAQVDWSARSWCFATTSATGGTTRRARCCRA